jgi:hypothetical protein
MKEIFKVLFYSSIVVLSYFFPNCSPSRQFINNENIVPKKYFENEENISFTVKDERNFDFQAIQSYDGVGTYNFKIPISGYVQQYLNKSLLKDSIKSNPNLVNVFIDQLRFEQDNSLKYSIRFATSINKDSSILLRVASKFIQTPKSKIDASEILDNALSECLDTFFVRNKDAGQRKVVIKNDYISQKPKNITKKDSSALDSSFLDDTSKISSTISEVKIEKIFEKKIDTQSIGLVYNTGENIESGFQLAYNRKISSNNLFYYGYGIGLLFYRINNLSDGFKGFLISAVFPLSVEYYLSESEYRPYVGISLKLSSGNEKIDYGGFDKTYFFFGPVFEPYIGLKLSNSISIDAGPYFLAFLGSKMLPNDFGARINLNIWLK